MYERLSTGLGSTKGIMMALAAVQPHSIAMLDLGMLRLGKSTVDALVEIFKAIPQGVTCVNFTGNDFGYMKGENIIKVFQSLPESVTTIDLSDNDFDAMPAEQLVQFIQAIPTFVTKINLSSNNLGRQSPQCLSDMFKAISEHVQSLNLRGNNLFKLTHHLPLVLAALPKNLRSLDLSFNHLNQLEVSNMLKALKAIPIGVNHLIMERTFYSMEPEFFRRLPEIFASFSEGIISLDLSSNLFGSMIEYNEQIFGDSLKNLTPTVVSLDLSSNKLESCTPEKLVNILSNLSRTVVFLDLGLNNLGKILDNSTLKEILHAIPKTVKVLSLRGNALGDISTEVFASLHKGLLYLDLSENTFFTDAQQQLTEIFDRSTKISFVSREVLLKEAYESMLLSDAGSFCSTNSIGGVSDSPPESEAEKPGKFFVQTHPDDTKEKRWGNENFLSVKTIRRYLSFTTELRYQDIDDMTISQKEKGARRKSI